MKVKNSLLISLVFLCGSTLFAQHNEEVTVEGTYRPKVNKVNKILMQAETPEQTFSMPGTDVSVLEIEHRFPIQLEKLSAYTLNSKDNQNTAATKNFLMAGIGTRLSPMFLYKHNSKLTKTLGLGVGISHYSSWLGIRNYAYSGFMNNAFDVNLTSSKFNNLQVSGDVYYKNDAVHYYGVLVDDWTGDESSLELATPRQTYNTIGTKLMMASTTTRRGEFAHNGSFDYHYLFARLGGGEHHVALDYDISYTERWWGKKESPQKVGLSVGLQYNRFASAFGNTTQAITSNRTLFKMNPYLEMKDDFYRLHLGFRVDMGTPHTGYLLGVYPDLKGSLHVLDNTVEFYAGLNGGRKQYTYSGIISENPFVTPNPNFQVAKVKLGFDGGVRTSFMNTLDLHLGVRYRHTDNDMFYEGQYNSVSSGSLQETPYSYFNAVYDETRMVSVLADARWLAWDKLTVDAGLAFNKYSMTLLDHPLYRPSVEGNLKVNYEFDENLSLYSSFLYQGGRYGRIGSVLLSVPSVKLKPVLDLSVGADYKVRDDLTAFAKIGNLLHQRYMLYINYPVTGFEFFAGVKMRF